MNATAQSLSEELGTDLLSQLSVDDQREVDKLNDQVTALTNENKTSLKERIKVFFIECLYILILTLSYLQLEAEKNKLENLLKNNLLRKIERTQADMIEMTGEDRKNKLELARVELDTSNTRIHENNARFRELDDQVEKLNREQRELLNQLEHWKAQEREQQEKINEDSKDLEKMTNKQSLLLKKKDECMRKIRELGSLPSDAFEKYQNLSRYVLLTKYLPCKVY
jgi:structural maintenance of chromosome 3 (chondroitin sulfate proteoglycan 6)